MKGITTKPTITARVVYQASCADCSHSKLAHRAGVCQVKGCATCGRKR